jgi:nucleotide-binding universal stress UspA family protein
MIAFRKILVPTDFVVSEKAALAFALDLAGRDNGELIVQHVVNDDIERFVHSAVAHDAGELLKHMISAAESGLKTLVADIAGRVPVRPVLSRGPIAEEICALAEKEQADVVVMTSSDGGNIGKVIRIMKRPVVVFPPTAGASAGADLKIQGILVATDLSEQSKQLVRYAFELKKKLDTSICLLHVIETSRAVEFAIVHGELRQTAEKMKSWALGELEKLTPPEFRGDARVVSCVLRGRAAHCIEGKAKEIAGCLTLVGTHRHGAAHAHLLGTTTDRLLKNLERPVLTVRLSAASAKAG